MRSCLHSVSLPELPILEVLREAKRHGYRAVELNAETLPWAPPHVTPKTTVAERKAIVESANALDLTLPALGAHIPMVDADPASRTAAIAFVSGCIDLAGDLGAPIVHILSGPLPQGVSRDEAWRWFAEAAAETTARAEKAGVVLGVEAIAGHLFHGVDDYHRLRKDLREAPWRVNFDPSHLIVQGENPMRVVEELADEVVHMHLKDGAGRFPEFTFPPLGSGDIDFKALTDRLRAIGYNGAMSIEYEAQVYGFKLSDEEILRSGRAFLSSLDVA
jgi:sugar phosphate isomerase/epimerase